MATNCLIKKLPVSFDDPSLVEVGELVFPVRSIADFGKNNSKFRFWSANSEMTISTDGDGYFALSYEGLDAPASRLTSYNVPASSDGTSLFLKNGDYNIHIKSKYVLTNILLSGNSPYANPLNIVLRNLTYMPALVSIVVPDAYGTLEDLKSVTTLQVLRIKTPTDADSHVSGKLSDLADLLELQEIVISRCNSITGELSQLGSLVNLTTIKLAQNSGYDSLISGTIESFVAAQRLAGRTTESGISCVFNHTNITFNGSLVSSSSVKTLSWTATTITYDGVTIEA